MEDFVVYVIVVDGLLLGMFKEIVVVLVGDKL